MIIKIIKNRLLFLIITSSLCAWIGVAFFIASLEFNKFLIIGYAVFTIAAVIIGIIGFVYILLKIKEAKLNDFLLLTLLVLMSLWVASTVLGTFDKYRIREAIANDRLPEVKEIYYLFNEYLKKNNYLPLAYPWLDSLGTRPDALYLFPMAGDHYASNFAFNKEISNLSPKELYGNEILVFEADGIGNIFGGPELINESREKDQFFLFKRQIWIYILFVDGTIVKYRIHDGSISKYDPEKDAFGPYIEKGKTPYSPLRWK